MVIASTFAPDAIFVTLEPDPARYAHARDPLAGTRAEIINARWQEDLEAALVVWR